MEGEKEQFGPEPASKISEGMSGKPPITPMDLPIDKEEIIGPKELIKQKQIPKPAVDPDLADNASDTVISSRRKSINWIWWVVGSFMLLLVVATVYYIFSQINFNQATVSFSFNPNGVALTIDGNVQDSVNFISVKLKAGEHTAMATKDGYLSWETDFVLLPGEEAAFNINLKLIPTANVLAEMSASFISLIRKDELIAYFDNNTGGLQAYNLSNGETVTLFDDSYTFSVLDKVVWSPSGVAAVVKLPETLKLNNMFDNTDVKGLYIPLGGSPEQAPSLSNGVATWLFDSDRQNVKGLQPVLMNENIRDVDFAPGGNQILYFYEAANGEKSLIQTENIDGSEWLRVETDVQANNPTLLWMQDDQYVLFLDDVGYPDRTLDINNREFTDIMPARVPNTLVLGSPGGDKILYLRNGSSGIELAVWDLFENAIITTLEQEMAAYTWQGNDSTIIALADGTLWYWWLDGKIRPVQFNNSSGTIRPTQLLYSDLNKQLYIYDGKRMVNFEVE